MFITSRLLSIATATLLLAVSSTTTGACSVTVDVGAPDYAIHDLDYAIDSDTVTCTFCHYANIQDCQEVHCNECTNARIETTKSNAQLFCPDYYSCSDTIVKGFSNIQCDGIGACFTFFITDFPASGATVNCLGNYGCQNAVIEGHTTTCGGVEVKCSVENACENAQISGTNSVSCDTATSCTEAVIDPCITPTSIATDRPTAAPSPPPTQGPTPSDGAMPTGGTPKNPSSGSGDPHFKTWTGEKFDYHGECDLVLVNNPYFADGLGLRVHIRTTRINYFSYMERIAIQIGEEVLEFSNDVDNFLINGVKAKPKEKWVQTMFADYHVRRDPSAISIRLDEENKVKIDLIKRAIGFPAVILDGGETDIFDGSLGLLGDWSTGSKIGRDGATELTNATIFAEEWQVRDTEPMLFETARFPQFPTKCTPPAKMLNSRLGRSHMEKEAEKACAGWKQDKEDCIFDVIATRDLSVAAEGNVYGDGKYSRSSRVSKFVKRVRAIPSPTRFAQWDSVKKVWTTVRKVQAGAA